MSSRFILLKLGFFAFAFGGFLSAQPASADIISIPPDSPITITGPNQPSVTLNFAPTPATEIFEVRGDTFTQLFPNQDSTTVAMAIATIFNTPTPTEIADQPGPVAPYNWVSGNNASVEVLWFYAMLQPAQSFTFSPPANLGNIHFFECVDPTPGCNGVPGMPPEPHPESVPEPATLTLLVTALTGIGLLGQRRRRILHNSRTIGAPSR